jgi:hypothetical protein
MTHHLWKFDLTGKGSCRKRSRPQARDPNDRTLDTENNPENLMHPENKQRLGRINQSSFDCIFGRPLATPSDRQEQARKHPRRAAWSRCILHH